MFKAFFFKKYLVVTEGILPLIPDGKTDWKTRKAISCLNQFFNDNPEALEPGVYLVETYFELPSTKLVFDVYQFASR